MATQEYLTIFLLSHNRDGAAQSVTIPDSVGGRRRSMWAFAAEWQVEPQNCEARPSKSIRHLHQQFRLAVCASTMCEYNGPSSGPRGYVEPALNCGVTFKVIKRNRHEALNRVDDRKASVFASRGSVKCPVWAAGVARLGDVMMGTAFSFHQSLLRMPSPLVLELTSSIPKDVFPEPTTTLPKCGTQSFFRVKGSVGITRK